MLTGCGDRDFIAPHVPALRTAGHDVEFVSFDAGHAIPLHLVQEVVLGLRARQGSAISVM